LLRQQTKLQKRKTRLQSHGLAISISRIRIITVKESFEVSNQCDKEFHKMAQNFGMIANYAEKATSTIMKGDKLPGGRTPEPETKKPRVEASGDVEVTEEKTTMA
jgi:hypothetical protein